jgi:hypothetical protein
LVVGPKTSGVPACKDRRLVPCCQRQLKAIQQEHFLRHLNQRANAVVDQAMENA